MYVHCFSLYQLRGKGQIALLAMHLRNGKIAMEFSADIPPAGSNKQVLIGMRNKSGSKSGGFRKSFEHQT